MTSGLTPKILHRGRISGIYCNALRDCSGKLESFGLIYDPSETIIDSSQPILQETQQYATNLAAPPSGTFASSVLVEDVFTIRTCYRGDRCTGITLTSIDGRVHVLGQWLECTGRHDVVFDMNRDGNFCGLLFELCGPPYSTVVRKVSLLTTEPSISSMGVLLQDAKDSVSTLTLMA